MKTESRPGFAVLVATCGTILLASCGGGGGGATTPPSGDTGNNWLIPVVEVFDGGPGQDGIPAIDMPVFQRTAGRL